MTLQASTVTRPLLATAEVAPIAPRPVPPSGNPYDRAIAVLQSTRSSIETLARKKGPSAVQNAFDRKAQTLGRGDRTGFGWTGAIVGGATFSITAAIAYFAGPGWISGGIGLVGAVVALGGVGLLTSNRRTESYAERKSTAQLTSHDVEKMLHAYMALPADERGMVHASVSADLRRLDQSLSPKAALLCDELLAKPAPSANQRMVERAGELATMVEEIQKNGTTTAQLDSLQALVDAAAPWERKHIASTMKRLFMNGERVAFQGDTTKHRKFYAMIDRAERGEGSPGQPQAE